MMVKTYKKYQKIFTRSQTPSQIFTSVTYSTVQRKQSELTLTVNTQLGTRAEEVVLTNGKRIADVKVAPAVKHWLLGSKYLAVRVNLEININIEVTQLSTFRNQRVFWTQITGCRRPPPSSPRGKTGRNQLNEEITPSFPLG
jgi:hypothetical protein